MLELILMIVALVCFGLSAFSVVTGKVQLVSLGLFAWALAVTIPLAKL